jgi:multiple sugar transport system permease protein
MALGESLLFHAALRAALRMWYERRAMGAIVVDSAVQYVYSGDQNALAQFLQPLLEGRIDMAIRTLGPQERAAETTTLVGARRQESLLKRIHLYFQREQVMGYTLIAPAFVLLAVLVAWPFFMALYFSLTDSWVGRPGSFIGLRNFWYLLHDAIFLQTLRNSFEFTFFAVILKTVLGMALALLLFRTVRFKKWVRGAVLLPWVIPTALSTLGWWWMFDSLYSVINWTLVNLGILEVGPNWLGTPHLAKTAVITVNVWRGIPFFAITILAGLVSIPSELYEAAKTDGAGAGAQFWYITLPMLKPVLAIVVLFSTIFTFSDFNIVYVLTRGGPINTTHLFATLANQIGLQSGKIGEGAAVSLFMFPILVMVVYFQLRFIRKD